MSARFSDDETSSFVAYNVAYQVCSGNCWLVRKVYLFESSTSSTEQILDSVFYPGGSAAPSHVSSDGTLVYYGSGGKIFVYDRVNTLLREVVQEFRDQTEAFDISSDGNFAVFPSDAPNNNGDFNAFLVDISLWSPPSYPHQPQLLRQSLLPYQLNVQANFRAAMWLAKTNRGKRKSNVYSNEP